MWMSFVKLAVRQTIVLASFKFVRQEPQFPGLGPATTPSREKLALLPGEPTGGKLFFAS
jgi:hypothetical protein